MTVDDFEDLFKGKTVSSDSVKKKTFKIEFYFKGELVAKAVRSFEEDDELGARGSARGHFFEIIWEEII